MMGLILKGVFKGREMGDMRNKLHFLELTSMAIHFLSCTLAKMKDNVT